MEDKTFKTELNYEQVDVFAKDETLFVVDGEEHTYFNVTMDWGLHLYESTRELDMVPFVDKMYKQIQSRIDIEPVDYHPYDVGLDVDVTGADRMRQSVEDTGKLLVSKADAEHPVFDLETNVKFRAVHDYMTHIQPKIPAGFTSAKEQGSIHQELRAYNIHAKTVPKAAMPALFTEVVGQVCTFYITGKFQEQKVCILDGFDYINVGVVNGYEIVNKELIKNETTA